MRKKSKKSRRKKDKQINRTPKQTESENEKVMEKGRQTDSESA